MKPKIHKAGYEVNTYCLIGRQRIGFTLVELLVAISIISLLMGILMPALSRARREARKIKCASRMRQIGLAFELYAADWDDWIITAKDIRMIEDGQQAWNFELLPYMGEKYDKDFDKAKLWFCPEDKDPFPIGYGSYPHGVGLTSYALNGYYAEAVPERPPRPAIPEAALGPAGYFKTFQIRMASACMLMVETSHSGQIYDAEHPRAAQYNLRDSDRSHHRNTSGFYHCNSMNILFVDGHVGNIRGRRCERVNAPWSVLQGGGMFWDDLTLPSATEKPELWGPGYGR